MLLLPSDPSWPLRFEEFATTIRAAGEDGWIIEHIGSTAIPGMSAKPVIDLAVRVETRERLDARLPELEAAGWCVGYEQVKHDAARAAADGVSSYNAGKTAVIQEIVNSARAARGLEPVDVYDKR